jgi:hypothetical protein
VFLAVLLWRRRPAAWRAGLLVPVGLLLVLTLLMTVLGWIVAAAPQVSGQVAQLAGELGLVLPPQPAGFAPGWAFSAVGALLPRILAARLASPWLALLLAVLLGAVTVLWIDHFGRREQREEGSALPFVLLLLFTGLLLVLGPEFVYLRDVFGQRLNTIFKFYYQAWVLFGVAALYGLGYLWQRARTAGAIAVLGYAALLLLALSFALAQASTPGRRP